MLDLPALEAKTPETHRVAGYTLAVDAEETLALVAGEKKEEHFWLPRRTPRRQGCARPTPLRSRLHLSKEYLSVLLKARTKAYPSTGMSRTSLRLSWLIQTVPCLLSGCQRMNGEAARCFRRRNS